MKKIISLCLAVLLATVAMPLNPNDLAAYSAPAVSQDAGDSANKDTSFVTIYAPDGKSAQVRAYQVEEYKNLGWYENLSDVVRTLYAYDGREIHVYLSEVEAYKKVGWFDDKDAVTTLICAVDGRQMRVYDHEVDEYLDVGWKMAQQDDELDPSKPMVALTFDDGPLPEPTNKILDIFKTYNAHATFFVIGELAIAFPEILQRAVSLGCQIGNHTYTHPKLAEISPQEVLSQINSTDDVIKKALGKYPSIMRPPYGNRSKSVDALMNTPLILWSLDTLDWEHLNANTTADIVLGSVKDGDIVLMHDIYDPTVEAVSVIVPELIERGFQLVTVEELARYKGVAMHKSTVYRSIE